MGASTTSPPHPRADLRPRMAFRVAVTGHRADGLREMDHQAASDAIAAVLAMVAREALARSTDGTRYRPEMPCLTLLSGMADGADRLAAAIALGDPAWRLHAVLPYAHDPTGRSPLATQTAEHSGALPRTADAVTTLDGEPDQFDAFLPLEAILIAQADLLLALWDGERAKGPGGTATVVQRARREGVPVVRIDPKDPGRPWLEALGEIDGGRGDGLAHLEATLADLMAAPPDDPLIEEFLNGALPRRPRSRLFERIVHLGAREPLRAAEAMPEDPGVTCASRWRREWQQLPGATVDQLTERFAEAHGWADAAGLWYGASFRQSFTAIFLLTVLAVMGAGLGAAEFEALGYAPEALEVVLLLMILHFVRRGRQARSQDRWLQYRSMAERLRHMAFLWPLGRTTPLVRVPGAGRPELKEQGAAEGWVAWYLRAVTREAGLITGTLDRSHSEAVRDWLLHAELIPQQAFHQSTARRSARIHHPLERWAERFVVLAVVLSLARLTGAIGFVTITIFHLTLSQVVAVELFMGPLLHAAAVTLPALAAGVHGFLGTADFEGTILRSGAIAPQLGRMANRLRRVEPVDLTEVGEIAVDVSRIMEGELGVWRTGAESRRLQA